MKKLEWNSSKDRLMDYVCVELVHPGNRVVPEEKELGLYGKYGFIWEAGPTTIGVCCRSARICKKLALKYQNQPFYDIVSDGSEMVCHVDKELLKDLIKILKIPQNRPSQAKYANNW